MAGARPSWPTGSTCRGRRSTRSRRGNTTRRCRSPSGSRGCSTCRSRRFSTMATRETTMPDDARDRGMVSIIGWATAIVIATGFIIGAFAGYSDAIAIRGGTPLPVWLGPLVALAFCGAAFTLYARHHRATWRQWSARKRRYGLAIALLALIGGIVGAWFSVQLPHDQGPFEAMRADVFSPAFALGASLLWVVGLVAEIGRAHVCTPGTNEHRVCRLLLETK